MLVPLHVSEKHRYVEDGRFIIYSDDTEKSYDCIDVKIDIYQARVEGWFFEVAHQLVKHGMNPGDYMAIMVGLSYLEGVQQFREGKETPDRKAGEWFKAGAKRVFAGQNDAVINRLWKEARCGLFHAGFTKGKIYLSHDNSEAIKMDGDFLYINPKEFLNCVSRDLEQYIKDLRNSANTDLRSKFETLWDFLWDKS